MTQSHPMNYSRKNQKTQIKRKPMKRKATLSRAVFLILFFFAIQFVMASDPPGTLPAWPWSGGGGGGSEAITN